jgi:hypothetical protein
LPGRDVFLVIGNGSSTMRAAPWAKAGQWAPWVQFLARESGNGWSGWFNATGGVMAADAFHGMANGAVFEGWIDLDSVYPGGVGQPPTLPVAVVACATNDGGALQGQAPAGDGDGDLDLAEYAAAPLYAAPAPQPVATAVARLVAFPTPFNAQVRLALEGAADGPVTVTIHDARGRTVRRLSAGVSGGQAQLMWDGRDEAGRVMASGTYFARSGGARPAVARLTMVK